MAAGRGIDQLSAWSTRFVEAAAGASNARASWRTALQARPGEILNLRDIEQALENFKRVPTTEVEIEIVPGEQPGASGGLGYGKSEQAKAGNIDTVTQVGSVLSGGSVSAENSSDGASSSCDC